MSLPEFSPQRSLFSVEHLLGPQFPATDRFRLFAERIYPLLVQARPQLEAAYCLDNGRAGLEPVLLLGVSLLQFMERQPDRQAVEMLRYHLGWKLALQQELQVAGFDPSSLVYFRDRLLEHAQAKLAFDTVLSGLREAGLVPKRGPQRLDSTHVLGAVARLSRLECVRETLRLALGELAKLDRGLPPGWEQLQERYVQGKLDYSLEEATGAQKYLEAGQDMARLWQWAQQQSPGVQAAEAMAVLGRVWAEHFEWVEGKLTQRKRPSGAVQNPHDPQAQWSTKRKTGPAGWVGYKVQVAETVEPQPRPAGEPTASFLTAVETQPATGGEAAGMSQVLEAQKQSGLEAPSELYVDSGYVSAEQIQTAAEQGRERVGPALGSSHQPKGFATEDFEVEVEERRAICPAGQSNSGCSRIHDKSSGKVGYRFEWGGPCQACPLRRACVPKGQGGRTLEVGEHHSYLQTRRRQQRTAEFAQRMHQRNGIEGTISELARGQGLRRARYRGLPKVRLQNYFIGAAANAKRWLARLGWQMRQAAGARAGSAGAREAATA